MTKTAKDMVTEAKGRVENLDPTQVAQEQERGAVIVDLRDGPEILENGKFQDRYISRVECLNFGRIPPARTTTLP